MKLSRAAGALSRCVWLFVLAIPLLQASCSRVDKASQVWGEYERVELTTETHTSIAGFLDAEEMLVRQRVDGRWLEREAALGNRKLDELALRSAVCMDLVGAKRRALAAGEVRRAPGLSVPIVGPSACIVVGRFAGQCWAFRILRKKEPDAYDGVVSYLEAFGG